MADKAISSRRPRRGRSGATEIKRAQPYIRRDKLVVLGAFILILGTVVAFDRVLRPGVRAAPAGAGAVAAGLSASGEFRGISLQLHSSDPNIPFETYIDEIAATGANTVSLVVAGYQENCDSASIFIDARKTPPAERIRRLIDRAHEKGLRVVLMPIVLLENPKDGEWRGKIAPANADWGAWWEDYVNYIMHYARLAEAAGVDMLMVGSELVSTESQGDRWRSLIARVRRAYKGRISYSANWDHYRPVKWWDALDAIGMTTYYDLSGGKKPTVERLMAAWKPIKRDILAWRARINLPIIFTEVGWPNQVTCAQYPWDYYRSTDKPDPQAQANCFEAFFRTWADEPNVAGILVWEWRNHPGQETAPDRDTSYTPTGKPAMEIVSRYFRRPIRKQRQKASTQPTATSRPAQL